MQFYYEVSLVLHCDQLVKIQYNVHNYTDILYNIYILHILISYLRAPVCIYLYILKVSRFDIIHQPIQQPRHAPIPPASRIGDVPTPAEKKVDSGAKSQHLGRISEFSELIWLFNSLYSLQTGTSPCLRGILYIYIYILYIYILILFTHFRTYFYGPWLPYVQCGTNNQRVGWENPQEWMI